MPSYLFVGLGGCGCRLVDALNRAAGRGSVTSGLKRLVTGGDEEEPDFETLAVDTDRSSLEELSSTKAEDRMHLSNALSSREEGKRYFREAEGRVTKRVDEKGQFDMIVLLAGGGGCTGSAFAPLLADRLADVAESDIYSVVVLPFRSEGEASMRAVRCLRELWESSAESTLLVDNAFLASSESSAEFERVNEKVARGLHRLVTDLETAMVAVADLGDLKSTLRAGNKISTMGFVEGLETSVDDAIRRSFSREGTLFPVDVYEEGAGALVILEGPEESMDTELFREELGNLSSRLFNVFKGVMVREGGGIDVLSVVSLSRSERLEEFIASATEESSISLDEVEEY